MAATTAPWVKGFTPNPANRARRSRQFHGLVQQIGRERVTHPGADDGNAVPLLLSRLEILARVLWTRAAVDGDMAAIKLLVECLQDKPELARSIEMCADDFAAARELAAIHADALIARAQIEDGAA